MRGQSSQAYLHRLLLAHLPIRREPASLRLGGTHITHYAARNTDQDSAAIFRDRERFVAHPLAQRGIRRGFAKYRLGLPVCASTTHTEGYSLYAPSFREVAYSAHSLVASPNKSAYVAAKHGIAGLTKTVALEVATKGITVNCISPGYVWTPLVESQIPDTMKARGLTREQVMNDVLLAGQPTKQFVTVDQVASLLLHLCRDESASITGANLSIDGGWTAA